MRAKQTIEAWCDAVVESAGAGGGGVAAMSVHSLLPCVDGRAFDRGKATSRLTSSAHS